MSQGFATHRLSWARRAADAGMNAGRLMNLTRVFEREVASGLLPGAVALVSRRGEGVVGMTYSINGHVGEPRVGVNPASALTPGILRRIFEPLPTTRSPSGAGGGTENGAPEARAAVANGRGNGALRKLGAVQEGVLRRSFLKNGLHLDQMLWSILKEEWRQAKSALGNGVIH